MQPLYILAITAALNQPTGHALHTFSSSVIDAYTVNILHICNTVAY